MHATLSSSADRIGRARFSDWPLALKSIIGFWFVYALTVAARALMGTDPLTVLFNKFIVISIGILLTGLVYVVISFFAEGGSIKKKAIVAGLASVVASWGMAGAFIGIEDLMREPRRSSATSRAKAS